jgi:hypothetical protein
MTFASTKQRHFLYGSYVLRVRPAYGIPITTQQLEAARPLVKKRHRTTSAITEAMTAVMSSAVFFLLSTVLLALCEYGPRIQIVYNL